MIRWAAKYPAPFWYVGPSYGLAKDTIWNDPRMLPQYIPDWYNPNSKLIKKMETELRVDFLHSHGQIYVYGSDRPELMRGPNPQGVILDEFSYQKREVWDSIVQPIMRANPSAWCWFLFTPCGRNHAADLYNYGLEDSKEWKSWKLTIHDSGIFNDEQIIEAQRTSLEPTWKSEYLCEFVEGQGAIFRGVRDNAIAKPQPPKPGHIYVMGVDLAKVTDFTAIAVYDRENNHQVYQDRFNVLEWPFQKKKIAMISRHYNNALVVIDATGVGDPIADDLLRVGIPVQPVKFTEQTKKELIEKLSLYIEQKSAIMIPIDQTFLEFDNFSYEIGPTGKIRYGARQGYHDDIVIAHALAISELHEIPKKEPQVGQTLIRQAYIQQVNQRFDPNQYENEWND